jgi:hypothetical protein
MSEFQPRKTAKSTTNFVSGKIGKTLARSGGRVVVKSAQRRRKKGRGGLDLDRHVLNHVVRKQITEVLDR